MPHRSAHVTETRSGARRVVSALPLVSRVGSRLCLVLSVAVAWTCAGAAAQAPTTTWSGVYSAEQAAEGEGLFLDVCAGCHQPDMSGGEDAPPLAGAPFVTKWDGHALADLFQLMRRSMPKGDEGSLSPAEYAQLIAHVLHRNGFPAGPTALPDSLDAMKRIRIAARQPGQ